MSSSVLPMFSSKSFIVSGLIFRSLIHFEFIFVYGVKVKVKLLSHVQLFETPWTVAYQAPPSMGFSLLFKMLFIQRKLIYNAMTYML